MKFHRLFLPGKIWSTRVTVDDLSATNSSGGHTVLSLGQPRIRWRKYHVEAVADPFLIVHKDRLWLFVEERRDYVPAYITAYSTNDLNNWVAHGTVLREKFHLSYPQVFESGGKHWMLPEAEASGGVILYETLSLPAGWVRAETLIRQPLADPTLFEKDGHFYIWGTDKNGTLRLFLSTQLRGPYSEHPCSPITANKRYSRCAGRILRAPNGSFVRLAQDCEKSYGENVNEINITSLTPSSYSERVAAHHILSMQERWNKYGTHHISTAVFLGKLVRAVDGLGPDRLWNNVPKAFWRACEKI